MYFIHYEIFLVSPYDIKTKVRNTVGNIILMNMASLHYLKCSIWYFKNWMICCKPFLVHDFTTICLIIYFNDWRGLICVFMFVSMMTNYNATKDDSWLKATWSNYNKISFYEHESTSQNLGIIVRIRFCPTNLTRFGKEFSNVSNDSEKNQDHDFIW